ncbi:hypothetical protein [Aquamicrobium sp. LC103]|uniref:hypothetical protein n=1 Tax=Aquamicrobium sp. LC103 TaxID=1120658 RepID=UPI000AD7FA80|nr:hypothetical protein [Aquamicrobium sp. LC103]TKT79288.1 hypothetical protein XW59_010215 [Aquamicrobium sp. LC103]
MMDRNALVPVMAVAIVNGIFSPWVLAVFVLYPIWYPFWAPPYSQAVYMVSALILSTLTVMISGVPAALYERFAPDGSGKVAAAIWLGCALLLTLPAVPNALRALGFGG